MSRYEYLKNVCVNGYAQLVSRKLQTLCLLQCPVGCNYIDPVTEEFVHNPEADKPNFAGYTAMMKLGFDVWNDDIVSEWYEELHLHPDSDELLRFITKDDVKSPVFWNEVVWILLQLDYE